jgi:glycosidase
LETLRRRLRALLSEDAITERTPYRVPTLWLAPFEPSTDIVETDALTFWSQAVERILERPAARAPVSDDAWSREAVVYNLLVRHACAFDHDGDGTISAATPEGVRETGTFLKAVALLPYIQSLGCNTVHLLPICSIGRDGRKGSLGSPYAICDPYRLDPMLAEPRVGIGAEGEFAAFVEAAHRLGIRVVLEFVFRTAAKDSVWIPRHPEWFYWIRAEIPDRDAGGIGYGSPRFPEADLARIKSAVARGDLDALLPPPETYRSLFTPPPPAAGIRSVGSRILGTLTDGRPVRIPGAFADWPPDDPQPPWDDVTYLRLYDHPEFNYIAYNTVRIYDPRLARPENEVSALWEQLIGVLPHYRERYRIDGAMIDMGHALPMPLKRRMLAPASAGDRAFAFWDEDFTLRPETRSEGYDASIGSFWWAVHRPDELHGVLRRWAEDGLPLPFLMTPETHNTPRCAARPGGAVRSACLWAFGAFLPGIPVIHAGFELGETRPVNTGLDFDESTRAAFPEETLPLYNAFALPWTARSELPAFLRRVLRLREAYAELVTPSAPATIELPATDGGIAYRRRGTNRSLLIVANLSERSRTVRVAGLARPAVPDTLIDRLTGEEHPMTEDPLELPLAPWKCAVLTEMQDA